MPARTCSDFRNSLARTDRRGFVKAGILGAAGLSLADVLRAQDTRGSPGNINSVIILWMRGGPSHIDMWDPKPDAPAEISRRVRRHAAPTCPASCSPTCCRMSARIMDKWSIVRSLHHHDAGHSTGDQICFTGYNPGPEPRRERLSVSCGSIVVQAARPPDPAAAGLRHDPADAARHRLGLSRRGAQAVRDAGRPGPARPVQAAELRAAERRHARTGRRRASRCCRTSTRIRRDVDSYRPARCGSTASSSRPGTS